MKNGFDKKKNKRVKSEKGEFLALPIEPRLKTRFTPPSKPKPGQILKSEIQRALLREAF